MGLYSKNSGIPLEPPVTRCITYGASELLNPLSLKLLSHLIFSNVFSGARGGLFGLDLEQFLSSRKQKLIKIGHLANKYFGAFTTSGNYSKLLGPTRSSCFY